MYRCWPHAAFFLHPIMRQWCHHTATRGGGASCEIRELPHLLPQLLLLPGDQPIGDCNVKGTSCATASEGCLGILLLLSRDSLLKHI